MYSNFLDKTWQAQSNTLPPFRYSPLSSCQIRILELRPGQNDSPLEIFLERSCLGALGCDYEALSYICGNPKREVPIKCNGAKLKITKSLHKALCCLRYPDRPRMLWVDAICINQKNLSERAQQVLLMKEIYPKAERVLAWLGEAEKNDDHTLRAINEWATFNRINRHDNDATRVSEFEREFASRPNYRDTLEAVGRMTYRPWFNQCWTFQEILLSTKAELLVGKLRMEWDCFFDALEAFPLKFLAENVMNFNALLMCRGKAKMRNTASTNSDSSPVSRNLSKFLQITRNFTANDPRDKIFSLLSISVTKNPCMFRPNYRISARDIFISWTFAIILDENSLNVITNCGEKKRDKSLPSWCPDWACKRGVTLTGYYDYISYKINAGMRPNFKYLKMKGHSELELEGAFIDVVEKVYDLEVLGDELRESAENGSFINVLSKFARKISLQECLLHDQLSPEAVLLRTLSADHWFFGAHLRGSYKEYWFPTHSKFQEKERVERNSIRSSNDSYRLSIRSRPRLDVHGMKSDPRRQNGDSVVNHDTRSNTENCAYKCEISFTHAVIANVYGKASPLYEGGRSFNDAKAIDAQTLSSIAKEAISQALFFFKGKKVLISREKLVAIGPENTKVGDSFCSFFGADVPFIIRKKKRFASEGTNKFCRGKKHDMIPYSCKIIGESYIDGIMYGELFENVKGIKENRSRSPREKKEECAHKILQPRVKWAQIKKFRIS